MGFFTPAEAAALAETTVRIATLVDLEFEAAPTGFSDGTLFSDGTGFAGGPLPVYLWNGFGDFVTGGRTYIGCGDLGQIDGLEEARNPVSQQVTFTLSAVADSPIDLLATALAETDLVQGNLAVVSIQLFDADWQPAGDPVPIYFGIMQPPRVTREQATAEGGGRRVLTLPTENLFFGRARPAAGRYTDREQQTRFPGDRFCEYTAQLVNKVISWPSYLWLLLALPPWELANRLGQGAFY